jgi:hypothetical protein
VTLTGSKEKESIVFLQVDAMIGGDRQMTIAYLDSMGETNILTIIVNGVPMQVEVAQKAGTVSKQVKLKSGLNRIEIQSRESIRIDRLAVGQ